MNKSFTITTLALAAVSAASAQSIQTSPVDIMTNLEALGMSANHRYVTGLNVATYRAFIWDTQDDTIVENDGDFPNCDFRSVTNDGVAYGIIGLDDMVTTNACSFGLNSEVNIIEEKMSQVFDVTPDGTIAVGCLLDDMWNPTACVWTNGKLSILPCPTDLDFGYDVKYEDIDEDGNTEIKQLQIIYGANAQYISADGKVIVGYMLDVHSSRPAIIWRQQADGSYKYETISRDVWEYGYGLGKTYLKFEPLGVSANGKWLCLASQKEAGDNMPTPEFMVRMNLETGEIIESGLPQTDFFDPELDSFYPSSIADDGTCVGTARISGIQMNGLIWHAGESAPRLLSDAFPTITQFEDYNFYLNVPVSISADGKYIAGFGSLFYEGEFGLDFDFQSYLFSVDGTGIANIKTRNIARSHNFDLNGRHIINNNARGLIISEQSKKIIK